MSQEDESIKAQLAALAADLRDPPYTMRDPLTGYALGGRTGNPTTHRVSMGILDDEFAQLREGYPANCHDLPLSNRVFILNEVTGHEPAPTLRILKGRGDEGQSSQFTYRGPPNLQQIPKAGMGEFFTLEETQHLPPGTLFLAFNPDTAKDAMEKFKAACDRMERSGQTETRDVQWERLLAISQAQINRLRVPILCKPAPNFPVIQAGYMMRSMAERIAREIQEEQDRFIMAGLRKGKPKPNTGPIGRKQRWRK